MTEEQLEAFGEQVANLTERLGEMANALDTIVSSQSQIAKSASDAKAKTDGLAASAEKSGRALENKAKIEQEVAEKERKREAARESAQTDAVRSLASFGDALLSTEKGFSKFSESFGYAGDAAFDLGKGFGPLGAVIGGVVKGLSVLAQLALGMADAQLTARDQLYSMGSAGAFNSEELLKMAHASGLNARNLELLIKPIKSMGPAVLSLGTSAGDSVQAFAKLTAVTEEERVRMNRLGVNQEELMQTQSDFVKLQQMSGVQISARFKTEDQLRKASLDYVTNLKELSIITGEDVETIKQRQQAAANEAELMIRQFQLEEQAIQLRKEGNIEEALKIEAQVKAEKAFLDTIASVGDPDLTAGFTEFLATGGNITSEAGAKLLRLGVDLDEVGSRLKAGDVDAGAFALQNYAESIRDTIRGPLGDAARFSEEFRDQFALTSNSIGRAISNAGTDIEQSAEDAAVATARAQTEGTDELADARANLVAVEIKAQQSLDNLVNSMINLPALMNMLADSVENLLELIPGVRTSRGIQKDINAEQETLKEYQQALEEAKQGGLFSGIRAASAQSGIEGALYRQAGYAVEQIEKGGTVDPLIIQQSIERLERAASQYPTGTEMAEAFQKKIEILKGASGTPEPSTLTSNPPVENSEVPPAAPAARASEEIPTDNYLRTVAELESGNNPNARASTSSASGTYQITDKTWEDAVSQMGKDWSLSDKNDTAKQEEVVNYLYEQQRDALERELGRKTTEQEMYMAHFLGQADAIKLLTEAVKNPQTSASELLPRAATSNPAIFSEGATATDIVDTLSNKFDTASNRVASESTPNNRQIIGTQTLDQTVTSITPPVVPNTASSTAPVVTTTQTPSLATSAATTVTRTPTPDQTLTSITPQAEASSREGFRTPPPPEAITASVPQTDINDIMMMLSYKLDTMIALLDTGVGIQDRLLLESRS